MLRLFGPAGPDTTEQALLARLNLSPTPTTATPLPDLLTTARVAALRPGDDDEWWGGDVSRLRTRSSFRLEVAAAARLAAAAAEAGADDVAAAVAAVIDAMAPEPPEPMALDSDTALVDWANGQGATCLLAQATTPTGLRGAAAARDIRPGDVVLRVPASLVLTPASASATDLGRALAALPLSGDDRFLLFCVVDAADPDSPRAPLWASLARVSDTGLTVADADAALLDGTAAGRALAAARAHVRAAAGAAAPALAAVATAFVRAVPGLARHATAAGYMRMVALLHSHAVDLVTGPPGTPPTPALIPPLYLANHAPCPHAVAYGRADPADGSVTVRAFRACGQNKEFFLSYGRLDATPALIFYGFCPVDDDTGVLVDVGGGGDTVTLRRCETAVAGDRGALRRALAAEAAALQLALDRARGRDGAWAETVVGYCEAVLEVAREAAQWLVDDR